MDTQTTAKHALTSVTILNADGPFSWKDRFYNTTYSTFGAANDALRTMASEMNAESSISFDVSFNVIWADGCKNEEFLKLYAADRDCLSNIIGNRLRALANVDNYQLVDVVADELESDENENAPMTYIRQYTLMQRNGIEQEGDEDVEGILLVGTVLTSWTTDHCDYGYDTVFVRPAYHDGEQAWLLTYHWNPGHGYTAAGDQEVIVDLMPGLQFLVEHEQFQALFGAEVPS